MNNPLNLPLNDLDPGLSVEALEEFDRRKQSEYDLSQKYKALFKSELGQEILSDLKSKTLDGPTWNYNMRAEDAVINGYAREGQNSIVRYILEKIQLADTLKKESD